MSDDADWHDHPMCDPGYEQCRDYQGRLKAQRAEIERLREVISDFLAAEDAVEKEAVRAEKNGGLGWSSAPVVHRIHAVKALREALTTARQRG